jgi:hypothetical protein
VIAYVGRREATLAEFIEGFPFYVRHSSSTWAFPLPILLAALLAVGISHKIRSLHWPAFLICGLASMVWPIFMILWRGEPTHFEVIAPVYLLPPIIGVGIGWLSGWIWNRRYRTPATQPIA